MLRIVASVANCQTLEYVIGSFYALGLSSTSLLFLSRVRAVYGNSKIITAIFGSMWVATLGLSIIVPLSVDSEVSRSVLLSVHRRGARPLIVSRAVSSTLV